jgi:hypothetical protein
MTKELPNSADKAGNRPSGRVYKVDFGKDEDAHNRVNPYELVDTEVVVAFLDQMSHPGAHSPSDELGEYIQRLLGDRNRTDMTPGDYAWRDRIKKIMVDIDSMDPDVVGELLAKDTVLKELFDALARTRDNAEELIEQRRALLLLADLRVGVAIRKMQRPELDAKWVGIVERLAGS